MTLALLAFVAGVMVGALAGAFVVSLAVAARRGDDMHDRAFTEWLQHKIESDPIARQAAKDEEAQLDWRTDVTWEEHA